MNTFFSLNKFEVNFHFLKRLSQSLKQWHRREKIFLIFACDRQFVAKVPAKVGYTVSLASAYKKLRSNQCQGQPSLEFRSK